MRYTPGISVHQGENNRDQVIIRGNSSSADFFVERRARRRAVLPRPLQPRPRGGAQGPERDDLRPRRRRRRRQPRHQGGRLPARPRGRRCRAARTATSASRRTSTSRSSEHGRRSASNGMYENSDSFRDQVDLERYGVNADRDGRGRRRHQASRSATSTCTTRASPIAASRRSRAGRPTWTSPRSTATRRQPRAARRRPRHRARSSTAPARLTLRNRTSYGDYDRFYQNYVPGAVDRRPGRSVALTAYNNATAARRTSSTRPTLICARDHGRRAAHAPGRRRAGAPGHRQLPQHRLLQQHGHVPSWSRSPHPDHHDAGDLPPERDRRRQPPDDQAWRRPTCRTRSSSRRRVQVVGGAALRPLRPDVPQQPQRRHARAASTTWCRRAPASSSSRSRPSRSTRSYSVSYLPSSGDQFSSLTTITEQVEPEKFTNYEVGAKWDAAPGLSLTTARLSAGPHQHALDRPQRPDAHRADRQPAHERLSSSASTGSVTSALAGRRRLRLPGRLRHQRHGRRARRARRWPGAAPHALALEQLPGPAAAGRRPSGVLYRTDMFATIDNTGDAAGLHARRTWPRSSRCTRDLRLQANVENAFDKTYWINADSNTNLSPGFPRALRLALTASF